MTRLPGSNQQRNKPTIITCGVYGYTAETFEQAVVASKLDVFVDTRRRRGVRGSQYSFANSKRLQAILANHGITYVHNIDLAPTQHAVRREGNIDKLRGIARHDRDSHSEEFVAEYRSSILDHFDAVALMKSLGNPTRVLIFCVELTPTACHRRLLAEAIVKQLGWEREDLVP